MDHYRSFTVYVPSTNDTRISDTLEWFPTHVSMPRASSADLAMASAYDLTQALLHPSPESALSPISDSHRHALKELAVIFSTAVGIGPTFPTLLAPNRDMAGPEILNRHNDPAASCTSTTPSSGEPRVNLTPAITASHDGPRVILTPSPPAPAEPRVTIAT